MRASGDRRIMLAMNRPLSSSKVLLVADRRATSSADTAATVSVRRYRIARIRFEGRDAGAGSRFDHLKRVYD
jgi:hypothetical protein